jgi:hypothetical protein
VRDFVGVNYYFYRILDLVTLMRMLVYGYISFLFQFYYFFLIQRLILKITSSFFFFFNFQFSISNSQL